jgi:transposase-like protein
MENNQEIKDLVVTEDLQAVLNVLKPEEAQVVLALKEELTDNWKKKQIFRTETEMRISVLNDATHPTAGSKYWQAVREQSAHFDGLMSVTFELRRNEVKRLRLEKELKEAQEEGDTLKVMELEIDLDENLYGKANMAQVAKDRVREVSLWSKLKAELNDGSFNDQDVNQHQAHSYLHTLQNRVSALNEQSNPSEIINAVGPLQTVQRLIQQDGKLATFDDARKQLQQGQ